jgi:nucleoside-diphosphate-sugar epimerase
MSQRILIAGAGDLGARIAIHLRQEGHQVWSIARRARIADPGIIALDLTQPIATQLPQGIDVLIHCLAPAVRDAAHYRATYVDGLANLLAALPGTRRVAFVSSTAVYGDHAGNWVDESAICAPAGFNGEVLRVAEALLQESERASLILRLGGLYGPGREMLLRRVLSGEPVNDTMPPLYSNRIHIEDAARAIAHLAVSELTGIFNVVDDQPAVQTEVLDWLADALGVARLPRCAASAAPENKRVSNTRLRESGFAFRYPGYREGYADIVDECLRRARE